MRRVLLAPLALSCALAAPAVRAQDLAATIAAALANAPAVAEADAGEAAATARLDRARAERNPLIRLDGSAGVGRIDNGGFFGITADDVNPLAFQATAEVPLYADSRIASATDQARAGAEAARFGARQARLQTTVRAVSTYAEVLTARQLELRYGLLVRELDETERQAQLRFKAGEIASSELAQARARQGEAKAGLAVLDAEREAIGGDAAVLDAEAMQIVAAWRLAALTGSDRP